MGRPVRKESQLPRADKGHPWLFDDFVAVHINQTLIIHYTATFLPWHRYFVWLYEKALREECDIGTGPSTRKTRRNPSSSTAPTPPCPATAPPSRTRASRPPCRPAALPGTPFNPNNTAYNPRCLKRDLNPYVSQIFTNASAVASLLQNSADIASFQLNMQGVPGSGNIGVHGGGHYTIGGDPLFFLHHGMTDRLWASWQAADPKNRQNAIAGTGTFSNHPPSPNVALDDYIDIGVNGGPVQIRSLMSTVAGTFCYVYV